MLTVTAITLLFNHSEIEHAIPAVIYSQAAMLPSGGCSNHTVK